MKMETNKMFEFATRNKIRFSSLRGEMSVEQLWDTPLRSKDGFDLDAVAKGANKTLKGLTEESFVSTERTPAVERAELALEIVKHVIQVKLAEEAAAKRRAENKVERERLLAILAEKQAGKLSELSEKELQKRINALEA
jgi:hypothetical protein